jgi:hypothetical protein
MQKPSPLIALMLTGALAALPAFAQALYKSTMPDGSVVYGDKPAPGAAKVEKTAVAPATKGVTPPSTSETATLKQLEADRKSREAAGERVRAAEKALKDAEAALESGKEPREGERLGTAKKDVNRLTDAYWERQKGLEAAVVQARRNLEDARAGK